MDIRWFFPLPICKDLVHLIIQLKLFAVYVNIYSRWLGCFRSGKNGRINERNLSTERDFPSYDERFFFFCWVFFVGLKTLKFVIYVWSSFLNMKKEAKMCRSTLYLLLMEEILHQLIGSLSHSLWGVILPRWCRISSINSSIMVSSKILFRNFLLLNVASSSQNAGGKMEFWCHCCHASASQYPQEPGWSDRWWISNSILPSHYGSMGRLYIWVLPKIGVPQNGWFIMENSFKFDDLGVPLFSETSIYLHEKPSKSTIHIGKYTYLSSHWRIPWGSSRHLLCQVFRSFNSRASKKCRCKIPAAGTQIWAQWHLAKKCPDPGRHVETYHFVYAIPGIVLTLSVSRGRYVVTLN